ncbi:MAG TPA: NUDIX domain-containing protein, partial [Thermomicrobiaceae bacterium]|nr:NUDIX domain-containing protein [Thermomicrobiaceae bacterium]
MTVPPGQRADEPFDILTAEGEATGRVKPRAAVHRDGDWHRAFHCWIGWRDRESGVSKLLVQKRSAGKDTVPNLLDVAVGGHYRAGESLEQVFREIEEELGITVSLDDLIPLGRRRSVGREGGVIDREI